MNYGAISRFRGCAVEPVPVSPQGASIGASLCRANAMSAAWDDMAAGLLSAIRTGDFTAYDTAMIKFRSHLRDGREPITPVRVNNGK
jgi:hypothetical protein